MQAQRISRLLSPCTLALAIVLSLAPPAFSLRGINYLTAVQGKVYIKRFLIFNLQASTGSLVQANQTLRVEAHSQATLICSNHTTHLLQPGTHAVGDYCPPYPPLPDSSRNPTRSPLEGNKPYIIAPRNTALLSPEGLLIQWHQAPLSSQDGEIKPTQITIQGKDVNWTIETTETEVLYQGTQTFTPDFNYTVIVETNGQSSEASFSVLPECEADRVKDAVASIQALNLDPDAEAIGLALMYLNYQHSDSDRHTNSLNLNALQVLQARIQSGTRNSQLYLLLAETYLRMDLPLEARQPFEQALELAQANNEQERLADSYRGLGEIAAQQAENEAAREFFQKALDLYETLSDAEQAEKIKSELRTLSNNEGRESNLRSQ